MTLPGIGASLAHDPKNEAVLARDHEQIKKCHSVLRAPRRTLGAVACLLLAFFTVVKL